MSSQLKLTSYGALATMAAALSLLSVFSTTALDRAGDVRGRARRWHLRAGAALTAALRVRADRRCPGDPDLGHPARRPRQGSFRPHPRPARVPPSWQRRPQRLHRDPSAPTPAPPHHGLVLLTVVGVAAIALVVDLLTVTLRRAALAGLPLLALFTVSAATGHHGVGIFPFVVGGDRLPVAALRRQPRQGRALGRRRRHRQRARPASAWSTDPSSAPAPASLGRQVGAVAISLGLRRPAVHPRPAHRDQQTWLGRLGGSGGGGSVQTFDPLVRVGADLAEVRRRAGADLSHLGSRPVLPADDLARTCSTEARSPPAR